MKNDEAGELRAKIEELKKQIASLGSDGQERQHRLLLAHIDALEQAVVALAVEVGEEVDAPDLIDRVSIRLTHAAAPALRQLKDPASDQSANAIESLASRLDQAEKRPKLQK